MLRKIADFIENKNITKVVASFRWVTSLPGTSYSNFNAIKPLIKKF